MVQAIQTGRSYIQNRYGTTRNKPGLSYEVGTTQKQYGGIYNTRVIQKKGSSKHSRGFQYMY